MKLIVDAIFWINATGCQWRNLDSKYPLWQTVFYYFTQFKLRGIWEDLLDSLVVFERKRQGREATPSLLAIDSQSAKTVQFVSEETGIDGGKKINGRKQTILLDKLRLPIAIKVTAANISDNQSGILAIDLLKGKVSRLQKIAADNGDKSAFFQYVKDTYKWEVEIAQRPESSTGFIPEKNRWQVERSFGWLNFRRRLFREVEKNYTFSRSNVANCFYVIYYQQNIIPKHTLRLELIFSSYYILLIQHQHALLNYIFQVNYLMLQHQHFLFYLFLAKAASLYRLSFLTMAIAVEQVVH